LLIWASAELNVILAEFKVACALAHTISAVAAA
jgi:hypothetical protein